MIKNKNIYCDYRKRFMNKTMSVAEELLYSTVKITAYLNGKAHGTGTGFFTAFDNDGENCFLALVTNKHVIEKSDQIKIICHVKNNEGEPSGNFVELSIGINDKQVIYHPDTKIDLCAISIAGLINQAIDQGMPIFYKFLDLSLIPNTDDWQYFDAIEEVTMIGCPNGISDEVNHLPIIRKGITASSLAKLYNGKQEFMVDMACFPGSSGSPIFLYDKKGYLDRKTNTYYMDKSRIHLVGILYAGPLINNNGQVILAQPPQVTVAAMMHLGNAIRSTELHVLNDEVRKFKSTLISAQV